MLAPERRDKLMTADDIAEWIGMHPESIRRSARQGRIPGTKFGGEWRFRREDVERAIFGDPEEVNAETM
jgi:excisionase family DNA binding protein